MSEQSFDDWVEAMAPKPRSDVYETPVGHEEGDACPFRNCNGFMGYEQVVDCSCHMNPPCAGCVDNPLVCLVCGSDTEGL